jgi:hypothetical protein
LNSPEWKGKSGILDLGIVKNGGEICHRVTHESLLLCSDPGSPHPAFNSQPLQISHPPPTHFIVKAFKLGEQFHAIEMHSRLRLPHLFLKHERFFQEPQLETEHMQSLGTRGTCESCEACTPCLRFQQASPSCVGTARSSSNSHTQEPTNKLMNPD